MATVEMQEELLMMVRKVVDMECWVGGEAESGRGSVLV